MTRRGPPGPPGGRVRLRVTVRGLVQGVGFRPFVHRLATASDLAGSVRNTMCGVAAEVEGPAESVDRFLCRLRAEAPAAALIEDIATEEIAPVGGEGFEIRASCGEGGETVTLIPPDLATCDACLREVCDAGDRRFRYPFTNCTLCGPRYTIIAALPYDRARTSMAGFALCPACRAEYEDPADRRFHAEPVACPACGPTLTLRDAGDAPVARGGDAIRGAAAALVIGQIVAVKGIGGFHLLADARNDRALSALRRVRARPDKPLAVMYPSIEAVRADCRLGEVEETVLRSAAAPIVLLDRRSDAAGPSRLLAPGNPALGVILPYTPLHHLLLGAVGGPVAATSANRPGEPIIASEDDARVRLPGLADLRLDHDRPILRRADDSIVRVLLGRPVVLRRGRGFAPLPVELPVESPPLVAAGARLKNAPALASGRRAWLGPHIGDLGTEQAILAHGEGLRGLRSLLGITPERVVADAHPDDPAAAAAGRDGAEVIRVQHHVAHVLACLAENGLEPPALGVAFDGFGFGADGTAWGGEFLWITASGVTRLGHLRTFPLPGGDAAAREPRRSALALLHETGRRDRLLDGTIPTSGAFAPAERDLLLAMLDRGVLSPRTSSAGRLFDAAASIAGLRQVATFEGQAAMDLEFALPATDDGGAYPVAFSAGVLDWEGILDGLLSDIGAGRPASVLSARFHAALADGILLAARAAGEEAVVLSGGCFQNRGLVERVERRLRMAGFRPFWHASIPPGDGGIALGQIVAAARRLSGGFHDVPRGARKDRADRG